jgi:LysM repeat protein
MKTHKDFSRLFFILGAISAVGLLPGCATYEGANTATQEREDLLVMREDINRCNDRLKTMEIEQQRILNEIQQLRAQGQDENTKAKLDEMERRITALDAARASDRQAIIDQLSGNVAKMMGGTATSKTAPKKAATSASDTGYEHVVKEGETLSAIATAYKVKPSAIIEANSLKNPDNLRKGQKLFIPQ